MSEPDSSSIPFHPPHLMGMLVNTRLMQNFLAFVHGICVVCKASPEYIVGSVVAVITWLCVTYPLLRFVSECVSVCLK